MANDDNIIRGEDNDFTLESILAEYKSSAYIDGDKKTPTDVLNEQAERIIMEESGRAEPGSQYPSETETISDELIYEYLDEESDDEVLPVTPTPPSLPEPEQGQEQKTPVITAIEDSVQTGEEALFFENFWYSEPDIDRSIVEEVEKAIEQEFDYEQEATETASRAFDIFDDYDDEEEFVVVEDPVFEEPQLKDAARKFAAASNSISLRSFSAFIVSLIMALLTFAFEAGMVIPFGIGRNEAVVAGILMISLLIVMMLCADLLVRGAVAIARGAPGAETLILFSCVFSLASGAVGIIFDGETVLLPYCVVSALSLVFAAFGEKRYLRAITDTLKTASETAEPYGLFADYSENIDKSVLKKASNRTDGFYNNLMHPDISETAYRLAAPILLVAALALAVLTALATGRGGYFLHIFSAMLAAAAPFSALLAFSVPFGSIAKSIRKSGAAMAGWGGADDICYTDGVCVTDDDLFPPGTISASGERLFEDVDYEKALRYTASLVIASGSGLSRVFADMLKDNRMSIIQVEEFSPYEGGIGALIHGERVMVGSAAFMNLLGIRVPDDTNMKNVLFTAVNDRLIAMFAINYVPTNSVQGALISIMKWRVKLFFAVRDFNVTPLMLEQKFKVSLEDVEYIPVANSYSISDLESEKEGRMAAILTREGFGPFADVVTGGRLLKSTTLIATIASIVSAAIGLLFMFYMSWTGAFLSARPGNLVVFMLSMLAVVLVVCGYVKCRK